MCYSATVSFAAGAVLIPTGVYCVRQAQRHTPRSLPFAVFPLAFGFQQLFEGLLWLSLGKQVDLLYPSAFGFLFFSHFFWLWWVPLSVWRLEPAGIKKSIALGFTTAGGIYGGFMYFPIVINEGWLQVELIRHSIVYDARLVYDGYITREWVRIIYALIVLIPLLIQTDRHARHFGILIMLSVLLAKLFFDYAFISVWCYFAAVLSLYVVYMLRRQAGQYSASPEKSR